MKKSFVLQFVTFLLALLMIIPLVSCTANNGDDDKTEAPTASQSKNNVATDAPTNSDNNGSSSSDVPTSPVTGVATDPETAVPTLPVTEDTTPDVTDPIPSSVKYDGKTMRILYWDDVEHQEFFVEADDGDAVNTALFTRNMRVEDRLGLTLIWEPQPGDSGNNTAWNTRMLAIMNDNSDDYSCFAGYSLSVASAAVNGYCSNLLDSSAEYMDFENVYWPDRLISEATFGNNLYFCSGDISANALYMMYVCYVNTTILDEHSLENPQELVESGDWTYDKFISMCEGIYSDDDGSGDKSVGDTFGYMVSELHTDPWFYGTGALIAEYDANGKLASSPSLTSDKVIDTIEKVHDLLYVSQDGYYSGDSAKHQKEFAAGKLLFMMDRCRVTFKVIASGEYDVKYSILPCPKYDKAQSSYVTVMGNPFTLYGIFGCANDKSMASAFLEYYAFESYNLVTPAVFEISLKTKYVQDDISGRMYDIVRENLSFDVGRIFSANVMKNADGQSLLRTPYKSATTPKWISVAGSKKKVINNNCTALQKALDPEFKG